MDKIKAEAKRLAEIQHECGMNLSITDFVDQFRFGLTQVVYEWARGMVGFQIRTKYVYILGNVWAEEQFVYNQYRIMPEVSAIRILLMARTPRALCDLKPLDPFGSEKKKKNSQIYK